MRYLIVSPEGLSLFSAPRIAMSSHAEEVFFCVMDPAQKNLGMGLENIDGWQKVKVIHEPFGVINKYKPSDLIIIIDDVGIGEMADHIRKEGYRVVGGSAFMDRLENDRTFGTQFMSKFMKVPKSTSFKSFNDGLSFLKSQDKGARFVFKPDDSAVPKNYTYVSKDITDMLFAINDFRKEWKWGESFQLQEFVVGIEVDFNAYFNGKEFLPNSFIIYFENKPLLNNDIGPATGGAIAVDITRPNKGKLFDILSKTIPFMQRVGYRGQMSINSMISEDNHEPYFLEVTSRWGYPSLPMEITLIEDNGKNFADLIDAMADGASPNLFPPSKVSVVVSVSTGWQSDPKEMRGEPLSWDKKNDKYFFPFAVMYDEKKKGMVLTGSSTESVIDVTCVGDTLDGAASMLYESYIPTLRLRGKIYRTDLPIDAKRRLKTLRDWGVL